MRSTFVAVGLLVVVPIASAQQPAPVAPLHELPLVLPLAGMPGVPGEDMLMFVSSEIGGRGVIKGAPYSATAVSETRQTLADGNRIVRSTSTKLYRDSQGRTRQEQAGGIVFINDVIAGKRVLLNTERKMARELPLRAPMAPPPPVPPTPPTPGVAPTTPTPPAAPVPPPQMSADEARTWAESMRQWAREFATRVRGDAATIERDVNVVVRRDGEGPDVKERVEVVRIVDDPRAGTPMHPGVPMMAPQGRGTTTALGSRDFDGVRADGTRTTWTIAAGRIGNEKPIEIVSERWYAPDLMLVVQSRFADPRSGERIYRLENLKRAEPSAELFRIPADFETRVRPAPRPETK
jgi:hypothetical protein